MLAKHFAETLIPLVTILAVHDALAAGTTAKTNPAITNYTRPISFEPNRGQAGKQVDFVAHGTGYSLVLSHAEAVMFCMAPAFG
ncbi:MAG: hypothetical protein ACJ74Z_00280 [Bryobacteraceae bacterium]